MTIKKKTYEKPVIQDLGRILTGSAQMPMGICSIGNSPSGAVTECTQGAGVYTDCSIGGIFNVAPTICQAGGVAGDDCSYGITVG